MDKFNDAHYFHLPSQGNIYTLTNFKLANGLTKLLVASLKREIFYFEYIETLAGALVPATKEVSFTYIPNGAEIISIDAFNKSATKNEFVIGITIIKNSNESDSLETFLNIYSEWEENDDFNIENIAQSCLNVELNFIPYKLLHTYLVQWQDDKIVNKEIVFVLSGSDHQVHVFRENSTDHEYKELENKELFPEFTKAPSPVISVDIYYSKDFSERITSFACECGYIKLTKVCTKTNKLVYNFSTRFSNYVSCVSLYPEYEEANIFDEKFAVREDEEERMVLNLVVTNTALPAVLFSDILKYGLSNYFTLPRPDSTSILTCCQAADINFDGRKEILIGNSSEEIMLYMYKDKQWRLEEVKKFASPIIKMDYVDVTGDGIRELVVLSMKGIHILQHDFNSVQEALDKKISALTIPK